MISTQKINLQEQREFSEKINATFAFLRQNFSPLLKALIYISGPLILISGIYTGWFTNPSEPLTPGENPFVYLSDLYAKLAPIFFLSFLTNTLIIGIVYSYMVLYQNAETPEISVGDVWQLVKKHILILLVASFLVSIIVGFGFMFLFIPGIILGTALSLIFIIIVRENQGLGHAFSRSFKLVSGNYLSTLGLLIVIAIIYFVIVMIFSIPNAILGGASVFLNSGDGVPDTETGTFRLIFIVCQIFYAIGSQLASVIILVAIGFQYFNLVEKKEAFGLMESIDNIGNKSSDTEEEETY